MDAKQLLRAAQALGIEKLAAGTGMGLYNPHTIRSPGTFTPPPTPAPAPQPKPDIPTDADYVRRGYAGSWDSLNRETGIPQGFFDPNKNNWAAANPANYGRSLWGGLNAGLGSIANLGGTALEASAQWAGHPEVERFARDLKWRGNARAMRGAHQFMNPEQNALGRLSDLEYKEQLDQGNTGVAQTMRAAENVGTSATDAIPYMLAGRGVKRIPGGGKFGAGKNFLGAAGQLQVLNPALTAIREAPNFQQDPNVGIEGGVQSGGGAVERRFANRLGETFGEFEAPAPLRKWYAQHGDGAEPNIDQDQLLEFTQRYLDDLYGPLEEAGAMGPTGQPPDPNGGMDPSLQRNPLQQIIDEPTGPYHPGPGQPPWDPTAQQASGQTAPSPGAPGGTGPAGQQPAPAGQPPSPQAPSGAETPVPQEAPSATGTPEDPGWAAANNVMTQGETDFAIASIEQAMAAGQEPDPQQIQQIYRSKAIHHLQKTMPGATPDQLDQELGSLMARGQEGDWTQEDLTAAIQNFAQNPQMAEAPQPTAGAPQPGQVPAATPAAEPGYADPAQDPRNAPVKPPTPDPQNPNFLQGFLDFFTGLQPWQQLSLVIGIPLAIGGFANAMFGGGGMGSMMLGGLGLGAAALGAFDPLGFNQGFGTGQQTTGATQPNASGQPQQRGIVDMLTGGAYGKAQAAADMDPSNPLYADTTRAAYEQMQGNPITRLLSQVPGDWNPTNRIRQNYDALQP